MPPLKGTLINQDATQPWYKYLDIGVQKKTFRVFKDPKLACSNKP
jgi:hypothetical protein